MRHDLLTQRALFCMEKGHAESAIRDVCRTSSEYGYHQR